MKVLFLTMWVCVAVACVARHVVRMNVRRLGKLGFISLVIGIAAFGSMKPDTLGHVVDFVGVLFGSGPMLSSSISSENEVVFDDNDWDGDGVPNEFEDRVFMDKHDPTDALSRRYDFGMTALAKYEVAADWRVVDTAGDGIADVWKLQYGLEPVAEDIGKLVATNGLTFWQSYVLGVNPLVKVTNPANAPLTDAQVVELGYSPQDTVPRELVVAGVPSGATVISLGLSGPGAPYVRVRVGAAVHAGMATGEYALQPGAVYDVVVERLPWMTGGAGLPVKVAIEAVRGIVAGLSGYTDEFVVPPEAGGFAPMSTLAQAPQIDVIYVSLEADNEACLHGHGRVVAKPRSAAYGVLASGSTVWNWVAEKNYGVLSPGGRSVSISVDKNAHDNWKAYKNEFAAGAIAARVTQPLRCAYTPSNSLLYTFDWFSGNWSADVEMGCCLTHEPEEAHGSHDTHITCKCSCCGCCCHCGNGYCDEWSDCCQPSTGTFTTAAGENGNSSFTGMLRHNNNWDL